MYHYLHCTYGDHVHVEIAHRIIESVFKSEVYESIPRGANGTDPTSALWSPNPRLARRLEVHESGHVAGAPLRATRPTLSSQSNNVSSQIIALEGDPSVPLASPVDGVVKILIQ